MTLKRIKFHVISSRLFKKGGSGTTRAEWTTHSRAVLMKASYPEGRPGKVKFPIQRSAKPLCTPVAA